MTCANVRWSRWLRILVVIATVSCADYVADKDSQRLAESTSCVSRANQSRWARASYRLTHTFGYGQGEELVDLWGITSTDEGVVLVWDAGNTRVIRLDSVLNVIDYFGRSGPGPGEFSYARTAPGKWIAAEDSTILVLDLRGRLAEYDLAGDFKHNRLDEPLFPVPVKGIYRHEGTVRWVADIIDRNDGARALETWQIGDDRRPRLLRVDSMPRLPKWQGRLVRGIYVYQAEPLAVMHGTCAYLSDGSSDVILRVDLIEGRLDSLRLPEREIPVPTREDERRMDGIRRMASGIGMNAGSGSVKPTARLKWEDIAVDPDGYVWLKPWRPFSMQDQPFSAVVVNPVTGAVDSVSLEMFPATFLPDGAYVTRDVDDDTRQMLLRRYAASSGS